MGSRVFVGLVHHPVYNKHMEIITTSVTNLDIHDIARCAATYAVERYYIIHPSAVQHELIADIITHWQSGWGASYNPDRKTALDIVQLRNSLAEVKAEIHGQFGGPVYLITTDAREYPNTISYQKMRGLLADSAEANYLLLFGTGYGMTKEMMLEADYVLEPIRGRGDYNHLSVRSAVSIILDRILGEKWWI